MRKTYTRQDYHDSVHELIEVVTGRYGSGLKAIYAGGSFARDDFVPGRSDIDLYVVARAGREQLQRELQREALRIEKERFPRLSSVFDGFLGISVTTLHEIQEGGSFLGSGFEYSNFIREGKLLWGEDIKALIPQPALESQQRSAKNYLEKVYGMVSSQEKYFKWLKWIPLALVPRAKKEHWTRQAFNLTFRTGALFLGSTGFFVSGKEDICSAFKQQVKNQRLRNMMCCALSLWEKWKDAPLSNGETSQLLGNAFELARELPLLDEASRQFSES